MSQRFDARLAELRSTHAEEDGRQQIAEPVHEFLARVIDRFERLAEARRNAFGHASDREAE